MNGIMPLSFLVGLESRYAEVPEGSDQRLRGDLRHERAQTLVKRPQRALPADSRTWPRLMTAPVNRRNLLQSTFFAAES